MISLIVEGVMSVLGIALRKIFPDKSPDDIHNILIEVKPEIESIVNASVLKAQAAVDGKEASSIFKFVAYARAALMYVCVGAFVYAEVLVPCILYFHPHMHLPAIQTAVMINLLCSLLGVDVTHHVMTRNQ